MSKAPFRRIARQTALALTAALVVPAVVPGSPRAAAGSEPPVIDAPRFREVGRVPVTTAPTADGRSSYPDTSGWLILDPTARRGYTIVEAAPSITLIQSFDLDTLQPGRRVEVQGFPIASGPNNVGLEGAIFAGDVIHAVDRTAGRIYLPMGTATPLGVHSDDKRTVTYFLVIDEAAFDSDPERAFGTFTFPLDQQHLQAYPLMGMTVTHHHVTPGEPGKLLALFASRNTLTAVPGLNTPIPGAFDHTLVQWSAGAVPTGSAPPASYLTPGALPVTGDWPPTVPTGCATSTLSTGAGSPEPTVGHKSYQWGILALRDAVLLGCQSAPNSGAVARVAVDPRTGLPSAEAQRLVPLGKPLGDVLVDEGGGRLFLKSFGGGGSTWWTFDAAAMRFTGSIAGPPGSAYAMEAGVDPATGRFYTLTPDDCVERPRNGLSGGGQLPVRGGLKVTEARLDPVPAPENVVPELAYNGLYRIGVDPVTRRVFVRRGQTNDIFQDRYPECDQHKRVPAPVEPFYRVYEDRIPLAQPPGELDDSALTTDTAEAQGRTEASFLGAASGYGARSLLTGGLDAVAGGAPTTVKSVCGKHDREARAGSVGKVEVSDQSTVAEAAALDADAGSREAMGDPLSRCRPQSGNATVDRCHADVREPSFDQARKDGADENKDGCTDRDGDNRYAARCLGKRSSASPGFDDNRTTKLRDGFEASVACDDEDERASAGAVGSMSSTDLEQASPDRAVTVARSSSAVTVARKAGKGVTVKVDSVARGVEIRGEGTIGVVRTEATATATGRVGGASSGFTRTVCAVDLAGVVVPGCVEDGAQMRTLVDRLNAALSGRGKVVLRHPDPAMARGTPYGYLAAVQRDRKELFADQIVTRDFSLAVPALEIVLYQGDGGAWGAGRQVFQLAGAQASTSYGIACTYGKRADGKCAAEGEQGFTALGDLPPDPGDAPATFGDPLVTTVTEYLDGGSTATAATTAGLATARESIVTRLLRAVPRAVAEALRLLFNNPRELGLLAALWALLYAPCYLGDRRRAVRRVAGRRLSSAAGTQ